MSPYDLPSQNGIQIPLTAHAVESGQGHQVDASSPSLHLATVATSSPPSSTSSSSPSSPTTVDSHDDVVGACVGYDSGPSPLSIAFLDDRLGRKVEEATSVYSAINHAVDATGRFLSSFDDAHLQNNNPSLPEWEDRQNEFVSLNRQVKDFSSKGLLVLRVCYPYIINALAEDSDDARRQESLRQIESICPTNDCKAQVVTAEHIIRNLGELTQEITIFKELFQDDVEEVRNAIKKNQARASTEIQIYEDRLSRCEAKAFSPSFVSEMEAMIRENRNKLAELGHAQRTLGVLELQMTPALEGIDRVVSYLASMIVLFKTVRNNYLQLPRLLETLATTTIKPDTIGLMKTDLKLVSTCFAELEVIFRAFARLDLTT